MQNILSNIHSPLFDGILPENRTAVLGCIGYKIQSFQKGEIIAFEEEHIKYIGILLSGAVDMIKEDLWGGKTLLLRVGKDELFGETFACGTDTLSFVTFTAAEHTQVLLLPFNKVMHTCTMACEFHHRLVENMVRVIAAKNRDLLRKIEIISKKTLRDKILTYLSLQSQLQNSRYVSVPLGRTELAEFLCADRSALTRELASMKQDGLIDFEKNMFRIL